MGRSARSVGCPRDVFPGFPVRQPGLWAGSPEAQRVSPEVLSAVELAMQVTLALRQARIAAGLSVPELAARSGLSRSTVWKVEEGLVWPDLFTIGLLAQALGMSMSVVGPRSPRIAPSSSVDGR